MQRVIFAGRAPQPKRAPEGKSERLVACRYWGHTLFDQFRQMHDNSTGNQSIPFSTKALLAEVEKQLNHLHASLTS